MESMVFNKNGHNYPKIKKNSEILRQPLFGNPRYKNENGLL